MMDGNTSILYTEILQRLDAVRRKENHTALISCVLIAAVGAIAFTLLLVVIERAFSLDTAGRTLLFIVALAGYMAAFSFYVARPLMRFLGIMQSSSANELALSVGRKFPGIRDRLLDALQLYEGRDTLKGHYSLSLIDATFSGLYADIRPLDFTEAISDERLRRLRRIAGYAFTAFVVLFALPPLGLFSSLDRIVHFGTSYADTLPVEIIIEPGNIEVLRGQNLPVRIHTKGKPVDRLSLLTREEGQQDFSQVNIAQTSPGEFQTEIKNLKTSTEYYAAVEDVKSDKFRITVVDRPLIRSLRLQVIAPAYTRIPPRMLDENVGDVSAYPGSRVAVELLSSKPLSEGFLVFSDSSRPALALTGDRANGTFSVKSDRSYHIQLKDQGGLANIDPVEYAIKIIPDEYPTVEILTPGKNIDLTEQMRLDLQYRLKDDFGFSKLRLAYRLVQSKYEAPAEDAAILDLPLPPAGQNAAESWYSWDLSSMHLAPEDVVSYYVEVLDNDNVSGPKAGRSETYLIRLPSLEEVFTDVSKNQQGSLESMQSMAKEAEQLKRDVEELQRDLKKNRDKADWQQQKKAEQMLQRYESMKKNLEQAAEKLDEAVKTMEENKLLSEKTMEKFQELQKLMEQLKSPELQEALKKLQEMMKQLTPEQMQQAMEQVKANEEQFRKNLERTLELLKRIAIEQKVDELVKRAEEALKQQQELKQETQQAKGGDQKKGQELAKKQDDLKEQAGSMQQQTSELSKKMEEFAKDMPLQEMKEAEQALQKSGLEQKMSEASKQMQSGKPQDAKESQEEAEQELSKFADMMKQISQAMQQAQMQQVVNQLRKQLDNALELSKQQEGLKQETKSLDPNSQKFRENTKEQSDLLNGLENVANALTEISKKSFAVSPEMGREVGNAMKQMEQAMGQMEARDPYGSGQRQMEAMGSLNRAAMLMQGALDALGKSGKGGLGMGGLMGRIGQMAGQQGAINSGTQQAMGMGQPGEGQGLTMEQQAAYQRLAQQQSGVQKSLQELSQEAKDAGEFSKLLGDLDRVAQEMTEVQTDLEQGNVNPETLQKQERILSRLLDSQRSMRERDYEKRRRAESGKDVERSSPGEIDLSTQTKNKLREELLKLRESRYSKDYEELIRKYFEQLEKEGVQQ